jgi:adenylate cyclase class 2
MQVEIEAKFVNCDHNDIRRKLQKLDAVCEQPMRLMRRVIMDYPDERLGSVQAWLRVRNEGNKVTVTYKQDAARSFGSAKEIETTVGSYEQTIALFEKLGLCVQSRQESQRETWKVGEVEVVLDIWPWLNPFIEIEGPTEQSVQDVAKQLNLNWQTAVFGTVTTVYKIQYPEIAREGKISTLPRIAFNEPLPKWFGKEKK